jgi:hypothetical protein
LEQNKENGSLWSEVQELWSTAFTEGGKLDIDSQMGLALKAMENWRGMSDMAKADWAKEL